MFFGKSKSEKIKTSRGSASAEDETVPRSGSGLARPPPSTKAASSSEIKPGSSTASTLLMLADTKKELDEVTEQLNVEKTAKRKLYTSLVKLANELKAERRKTANLTAQQPEQNWYQGGLWRAPKVLPGVGATRRQQQTTLQRQPIGLSDLFFNLVTVTAFTRVGMAVASRNGLDGTELAYFAVFWMIWSKETSYSTRFETTDVSAQLVTLLTCFAVLFGSLSTFGDLGTEDATRIMMVAMFVALLHCCLHLRVAYWYRTAGPDTVEAHVRSFAVFTVLMTLLEASSWSIGIWILDELSPYRWVVFLLGILLSLRVPRSFLANDFHAASDKSGVIFILLLGYLLQSVVLVASPFFEYETPNWEQYGFIGSSCFLLFTIKLLYVDDFSSSGTKDHPLLVNRTAGFFFHVGQFFLLLSTTVLGSGLNLLTHSYMAAAAALPDNAKVLVCGGFSAVIASIFFIKSMHLRRVPTEPTPRSLFVGAYILQTIVMLGVVAVTARMCFADAGYLVVIMRNEIQMMFSLSAFALFLLLMSWLDNAVELSLFGDDSRQYMVHPFGFWWCLRAEVEDEEVEAAAFMSDRRLSSLSPLLGSSVANMKNLSSASLDYGTIKETDEEMAPLKI